MIDKAATRYTSETGQALEKDEKKHPQNKKRRRGDLTDEFTRAASDDNNGGGGRRRQSHRRSRLPTKPKGRAADRPRRTAGARIRTSTAGCNELLRYEHFQCHFDQCVGTLFYGCRIPFAVCSNIAVQL